MKVNSLLASLLLCSALALTGCREEGPKPESSEATARDTKKPATASKQNQAGDEEALKEFLSGNKKAAAQPAAGTDALPPGHPPIDMGRGARKAQGNPALPAGHPTAPGGAQRPNANLPPLEYEAPAGWKKNPPSRMFRAAEFDIPSATEGGDAAQMIVYYFGPGQGGGVEDNLARWKGMFTTDDGQPVGDDAVAVEKMEANGLKVTTIDVKGRYSDMMSRPKQAGPTDVAYRLLGAIVETPDGKWFFKGVGPAPTMDANHDAFMAMLKTMKRP